MIFTNSFPLADEIWKELNKDKKYWSTWRNMCKVAEQKAKVKNQAIGGQDQFGASHGKLKQAPFSAQQANGPPRLDDDIDEYFNALSEAATTEKGVSEKLV